MNFLQLAVILTWVSITIAAPYPGPAYSEGPYSSSYANVDTSRRGVYSGVEAGVGRTQGANGISAGYAIGPNAGANADAGLGSTGFGLKASLGEIGGSVGIAGGNLGLSADTGFSVGSDGWKSKVLGSGMEISREKGVKLCLFGSCLWIG